MGAFELGSRTGTERNCASGGDVLGTSTSLDPNRLREECIIALKVYDSCRQQD